MKKEMLHTAAHVALAALDNQRESVLWYHMVLTFLRIFIQIFLKLYFLKCTNDE